ncbi:MAG: carbamoyltransferase, partial [Planctomycetes bacterium]|nr:carbamoyltransferase [Planctomycetota bacterium]
ASLQQRLEQALVHLAQIAHRATGLTDLCLAGGVALNSVANAKLLEQTPFKRIYVQPAAGDDGTALGAAALVCAGAGLPRFEMRHACWGSRFSDAEMESALADHGDLDVMRLPESELCARAARLVAQGGIVGWFQGAMEWGPRALGNRSIVAHPGLADMRDRLNARIKQREAFRPFAPAILEECLGDYFESTHPSPFMLMVYRTRPQRRAELAAVDHVDHTGRVQTVSRDTNGRFHALISAFAGITGTPALLNTSFNENEPVVCTPAEALDCFARTGMDAVVLGDFLCTRRGDTAAAAARAHARGDTP